MQAIKQAGKVLASAVAGGCIVLAFLFAWTAFVLEGAGRFDAAIAFLWLGIAAGSGGGSVLAWLWLKNF